MVMLASDPRSSASASPAVSVSGTVTLRQAGSDRVALTVTGEPSVDHYIMGRSEHRPQKKSPLTPGASGEREQGRVANTAAERRYRRR